jgi:hypothetical protein
VRTSLEELQQKGCPAIVHLRQPDHFAVLAGVGAEYVSLLDGGVLRVVQKDALRRRFSGAAVIPAGAMEAAARARIEEPVHVVKFASAGSMRTEKVAITNAGMEPLDVRVLATACNCAAAEVSPERIAPGERATLSVAVRPRGWGSAVESVTLSTSDPLVPRLVVALFVQMPRKVMPQPERLAVRVRERQTATRELTLLLERGSVGSCTTRHSFVSARVVSKQPVTGGFAHRIEVVVSPNAPCGRFTDEITFELKDADVPRVSVPVEGIVEPDVAANPSQVFFGMVAPGATGVRTAVVASRSGRRFAVQRVQAKDPRVMLRAECGPMASSHAITVKVVAKGEPGAIIRDRVKVTLGDGGTLEIGVFAMIGPAEEGPAKP